MKEYRLTGSTGFAGLVGDLTGAALGRRDAMHF